MQVHFTAIQSGGRDKRRDGGRSGVRVHFGNVTHQLEQDVQPLLRAPKGFIELVAFSVTVSVVSQLVMRYFFDKRR